MISQLWASQAISAKMRPKISEMHDGSSLLLCTRTWCDAAYPIINSQTTKIAESVIAAKTLAVVLPIKTAISAWIIVKTSEERGLITMSQTA